MINQYRDLKFMLIDVFGHLKTDLSCRMMQRSAILAHNQKVVGSNPTPAPNRDEQLTTLEATL